MDPSLRLRVAVAAALAAGVVGLALYSRRRPSTGGSAPLPANEPRSETIGIPDIEGLDPKECGFERPLEGTFVEIHGSIKPITFHLLVATAVEPRDWPSEAADACPVLKALLAERLPKPQVLSGQLFHAPPLASGEGRTVLAFPQRRAFAGVTPATAGAILQCLQTEDYASLPPGVTCTAAPDFHVFICAHRNRDGRCGYCGPVLFAEFQKELHNRRLSEVQLHKVSHVSGHKYAGNVLIYGPRLLDWYAYVTPSDVRELINLAIIREEWLPRLWRGRVGIDQEESNRMRDMCREINANR